MTARQELAELESQLKAVTASRSAAVLQQSSPEPTQDAAAEPATEKLLAQQRELEDELATLRTEQRACLQTMASQKQELTRLEDVLSRSHHQACAVWWGLSS